MEFPDSTFDFHFKISIDVRENLSPKSWEGHKMNPNDQTLSVTFTDSSRHESKGVLRLIHNNGNTQLTFYKDLATDLPRSGNSKREYAKQPDCNFYLSSFHVILIDPQNPLLIRLSSARDNCRFTCNSMADQSRFMDYISQKVRIVHSELNPDLFLLESIDLGQLPFTATLLPHPTRPQQKLALAHWEQLTGRQPFTPERITSSGVDVSRFYNAEFDDSVVFDIFRTLLLPPPKAPDVTFFDLKKQWQSLSPRQLANNPELRKFIQCLEAYISRSSGRFDKYTNPRLVKKMFFDIILTYSFYNWDGIRLSEGVFDLLFPFLDAFVKQNGEEDVRGVSEVFDVFSVFYEQNAFFDVKKGQKWTFIQPILINVGKMLDSTFNEIIQILNQKHIFSLDFLRNDCGTWFINVFNEDDIKVFWISALAFGGTKEFFESFLIALLILLMNELNELNPLGLQEFVDQFNEVKMKVDLRMLLVKTKYVHEMCREAVALSVKTVTFH
jgi:hypothetical protein